MPIQPTSYYPTHNLYSVPPRYSEKVWESCKECFGGFSSFANTELKKFYRTHTTLGALYEMVAYYDKRPPRKPRDDILYQVALAAARKAFTIGKYPMRHINDISEQHMTTNTNPGAPYAWWGFTKKIQILDLAKERARQLFHHIKMGESRRLPPSMIFSRNAIAERGKRKLRAIWGKSLDLLLGEISIYGPWHEAYLKSTNTPSGYQYTVYHGGYRKLYDEIVKLGFPQTGIAVLTDIKKADTSYAPWLINDAFDIIQDQIDFGSYERFGTPVPSRTRRLAKRLQRETINTEFVMPDGMGFRKETGVDTGSYIFQRIEDIGTYIATVYCALEQGRKIKFIRVLGDDNFSILDGNYDIDWPRWKSTALRVFGMELSDEKSYHGKDWDQLSFLGRKISHGIPRRDTVDLVLSALYPKTGDKTDFDLAQRIVALMYENCYNNDSATRFLERCWEKIDEDVRHYCEYSSVTWSYKWIKMFRRMGLSTIPRCRPPDKFELWLMVIK